MPRMTSDNRCWALKRYPEGMPAPDDWELTSCDRPEPGDGEILVRTLWLSVDPYMRGRISPAKNYAAGIAVGDVMKGGGVGEVVRSNHADLDVGDTVECAGFAWQDFCVLPGAESRKLDPDLAPVQMSLSVLGMPGMTAYFSLLETGAAKAGETVVISAASGAVGQVAGQIARIVGCRAVAVAGSDEKLAWCREIGYDAGVNHRSAEDLTAALAAACPDGIDVYLDNTAGPIHDAAMANLNTFGRVVIVGTIALADRFGQPDIGLRHLRQILVTRARVQGFLFNDFMDRRDAAIEQLAAWYREGKLSYREDVMEGLENTPQAFVRMLKGENFGKQLVRVSNS